MAQQLGRNGARAAYVSTHARLPSAMVAGRKANRLHRSSHGRAVDNLCDFGGRGCGPGDEETADATWMPDNNSIVFGPWSCIGSLGIRVLDVNTNHVSPLPGATEMWSPRVSPEGRYIAALSQHETKMMLFDIKTQKWEEISDHYSGYPSWSRDGEYLYFQDWYRGSGYPSRVERMRIRDRKLEIVVDLKSFDRLSIGTYMSWSGLAADDSVLLSRNNSTQEIYAVKW